MITFKNSLKLILIHLFIYSVISVNAADKDINYQKPKMCWVIEDNIRITQPVKIRFYILKDTAIQVYEEELTCAGILDLNYESTLKLNLAMAEVYNFYSKDLLESNSGIVSRYLNPIPCHNNL
ncbi:MAG: hypothetical protein KA143_01750 [Saprospiraceae bacterium]|nr:hypothetical protein [Saprospiraceae bacterium]